MDVVQGAGVARFAARVLATLGLTAAAAGASALPAAALPLAPAVTVTAGGAGNTAVWAHPSLRVTISQRAGQAHLQAGQLVLPRAINVDVKARALKHVCPRSVYARNGCSRLATVGRAEARSPAISKPLGGTVFLLQKRGALPDLVIRLRNAQLRLDLIAVLNFRPDGRIVARVDDIPDVPLTDFALTIDGGRNGALLNRSDLCSGSQTAQATFRGHGGERATARPPVAITGCS